MNQTDEVDDAEVGPRSLFFLRAITAATVVIVIFFIVDAIFA